MLRQSPQTSLACAQARLVLLALACGLSVLGTACKQDVGERCEVDSDCADPDQNYCNNQGGTTDRATAGTCQPRFGMDAGGPDATVEAGSDGALDSDGDGPIGETGAALDGAAEAASETGAPDGAGADAPDAAGDTPTEAPSTDGAAADGLIDSSLDLLG